MVTGAVEPYAAEVGLVVLLPLVLLAVGGVGYTAWKSGRRAATFAGVVLLFDAALLFLLPFPLGFVALAAAVPFVTFVQTYATFRRMRSTTMRPVDWPELSAKAAPVVAELTAHGFVPAAACAWDLTTPPTLHLLLVHEPAGAYADVTWNPRADTVLFSIESDLPGGGKLLTSRLGQLDQPPEVLRQVFPLHVASQLVWFHLSAIELLASRGILVERATFARTLPRWLESFATDQRRLADDAVSLAWRGSWRVFVRRVLDRGPLWAHPDLEAALAGYFSATGTQPIVGHRAPWTPPDLTPRPPPPTPPPPSPWG